MLRWRLAGAATLLLTAFAPLLLTPASGAVEARGHSQARGALLRAGPRITRPALSQRGRRVSAGRTVAAVSSTNWSGYGGLAPSGSYSGAAANWTVPAVGASGGKLYSASWVGVDGWFNTGGDGDVNSWLIQTGTEQDSGATGVTYYPWYEIITPTDPAPETLIDAPVAPGDAMTANLQELRPGVWQIYLGDVTRNWYFNQSYPYAGPAHSTEWIEEAPTVDGMQSSPAHFGSVDFAATAVYDGVHWSSTAMTSDNAVDLVGAGAVLAAPGPISAPGATGQSFTDIYRPPTTTTTTVTTPTPPDPPTSVPTTVAPPYPTTTSTLPTSASTVPPTTTTTAPTVRPPSDPTRVTATPGRGFIRVRWGAPRRNGGAAIVRYLIDEYHAGRIIRVFRTTSLGITAVGLDHRWHYSYAVAASNGRFTSSLSGRTLPLRPAR